MPHKRLLIISSLLLVSTSAHAIPPPDVFMSLWQSILQMFGMLSVFVVGAYYSVKQFFGVSLNFSAWKRPLLFIVVAVSAMGIVVGPYMHFFNAGLAKTDTPVTTTNNDISQMPDIPKPTNNNPKLPDIKQAVTGLIKGENLPIYDVLTLETDEFTRNWKFDTFKEMQKEANLERQRSQLPAVTFETITSFSPKSLYRHTQKNPRGLFLLDVRGAYERKMFHLPVIPNQSSVRYGDLLNNDLPLELKKQLPKNKRIVLICHSGLRGYFAANLLRQQGYENVSFLQGGLASWHQQKLPTVGKEDYNQNMGLIYPVFTDISARDATGVQKIEIDSGEGFVKDIEGLVELPFETASSKEINTVIEQSKSKPILMTCRGYSGCFHTLNFGYLIEQRGGKVAGVYDRTGEFIIPPTIN